MIPISQVKGPILKSLYIYFCLTGLYFGDVAHQLARTICKGSSRNRLVPKTSKSSCPSSLLRHFISTILLLSHLYLLYQNGNQVLSIVVSNRAYLHLQMFNHPTNITSSSPTVIAISSDESQFQSHLKPISRLVFRLYMLAFYGDYLCMLLYLLFNGQPLIRLLSYSSYELIDNCSSNRRAVYSVICALFGFNVIVWVVYNYVVSDWSKNGFLSLLEVLNLLQLNNHYLVTYFVWFYACWVNLRCFEQVRGEVEKATHLVDLSPIKRTIHGLSHNLNQFYSTLSPLLLSKITFSSINTIFTLLYLYFQIPDRAFYYQRLLLVDLAISITCDCILFYQGSALIESYDRFVETLIDQLLNLMLQTGSLSLLYSKSSNKGTRKLNSAIKNDLKAIDRQYREFVRPRLFRLSTLDLQFQLKIVLFSVNFAIVLFQTEKM